MSGEGILWPVLNINVVRVTQIPRHDNDSILFRQFDKGARKWELVCNPLSRVYFGNWVTEIHHFSLLKAIIVHNSYFFDNFQAFFIVFDHVNACTSMHSLVEIHNNQNRFLSVLFIFFDFGVQNFHLLLVCFIDFNFFCSSFYYFNLILS